VSPISTASTAGSSSSNLPSSTLSSSTSTQSSSNHSSTTGNSTGSSSTSAASNSASSNGSSTQTSDSDAEGSDSSSSTTGAESSTGSQTSDTGGGSTDTNVSTSTGGSGTGMTSDGTAPTGDAAVPSGGCEEVDGLETLKMGGMSVSGGLPTSTRLSLNGRDFIIDIPEDYEPNHPYRLIFSWHQAYGSANGNAVGQYPANNGDNFDAEHYAYFGLRRAATEANESAIFVAPQGIGNFPWDYARDVVVFDNLLEHIGTNLCIDENRVFTTGFSFGAMMSHALSLGRRDKLRAAVTMAPANYNFTQPTDTNAPFAYFGITGMSDGTCQWIRNGNSTTEGGKYCVLTHAENNGCTIPNDIMTAMNGSKNHVCYDFEGCDAGYPVKVCTFDGNHTPSAVADGMSGGDDGLDAFVPPLAWEFISQF
jgi:predicted esterase